MLKEGIEINPGELAPRIKDFIAAKVEEAGADGVILGMSGGLDSSLAAFLCAEALGAEKVSALAMPERESRKEDTEEALSFAKKLGVRCRVIDITSIIEACKGASGSGDRRSLGNLKARVRMALLYYHANRENRLVVGTSNRSEISVGYFTKHGDGAADLAPLGTLYKTQVKRLAEHLKLPRRIIDKEPSAGLWPGQTDEGELGLPYAVLDLVLCGIEKGMDEEAIAGELGLERKEVRRVSLLVERGSHKRSPPAMPELS